MPIRPASTDTTVAVSSTSVIAWMTCATHSHLRGFPMRTGEKPSLLWPAPKIASPKCAPPHPVVGFLQCGDAHQTQCTHDIRWDICLGQTVRQLSQQRRVIFTFKQTLEITQLFLMARLLHPSEIFASWWCTIQSPTQPVPVERLAAATRKQRFLALLGCNGLLILRNHTTPLIPGNNTNRLRCGFANALGAVTFGGDISDGEF